MIILLDSSSDEELVSTSNRISIFAVLFTCVLIVASLIAQALFDPCVSYVGR